MRDALNFFEPYESLPATHENQLTRAFLVVLKLVPLAHSTWLRLVSTGRGAEAVPLPPIEALPPAGFQTQKGSIGAPAVSEAEREDRRGRRAISVFQAGDVGADDAPAEVSRRKPVFDGIVRYGDDLALVIESKLDGNLDERQAREITIEENTWELDPVRARLRWRDIISAWRDLLLRDLVSGAERKVLEDFLWFVQRHFDRLQPFSELAMCRGNWYLLRLRCQAILDEAGPGPTENRGGHVSLQLEGARSVKLAYLETDDGESSDSTVRLVVYPGDTLEQAQRLYTGPDSVERLLALREVGWDVRPNFHFGHMAKGFAWTSGDITVDDYVRHWVSEIATVRQVKRADWERYFSELLRLEIAKRSDKESFDQAFEETDRQTATPRPGLRMDRTWDFDEAAELDRQREFVLEVRNELNRVLGALGEPQLPTT